MKAVAPFTGAWIEIFRSHVKLIGRFVAPFTGAWIEIRLTRNIVKAGQKVAPFTGAWIEIGSTRS